MSRTRQAANAAWAAAVAGLAALSASLIGSESLAQVTAGQWIAVALGALIAGGSVYGFTTADTPAPASKT
jgi:hypothetical protein